MASSYDKPSDAVRVDLTDPGDMRNWCRKWRCTQAQLQEAVSQVGPLASNVQAYLVQRAVSTYFISPPVPPNRLS